MILAPPKNLAQIRHLFLLTLILIFLSPFTVMAAPDILSCTEAQRQIEKTQNTLQPLKQEQKQIQQDVRNLYHELFACQTEKRLPLAEQHCTKLQEEGPKQFKAMVEAITRSHKTTQQLAHQTLQAHFICTKQS